MPRVSRWLCWYEKEGDAFVGEVPLKGLSLARLQVLFNLSADNLMYGSASVRPEHVATLQAKVDHQIDLERYDYFVETYAEK